MSDRLLIGTYNALLYWDGDKAHVVREGVHYGVTWDGERVYASYNPPDGGTVIQTFDADLNYQGDLPVPNLWAVHQIYWRGTLYSANTHYNRIEIWDGEKASEVHWIDDDLCRNDAKDRIHLNSIWHSGIHWYVVEHGYTRPPAKIRVFDDEWNQIKLTLLDYSDQDDLNAHNIYTEVYLYVCRHRRIDVRDRTNHKLLERVYPYGEERAAFLLRGLARTESYFYVGASTYAEREHRAEHDSDILILDKDLRLVDSIYLKGAGQVYEVRVLGELDYAHNWIVQ